ASESGSTTMQTNREMQQCEPIRKHAVLWPNRSRRSGLWNGLEATRSTLRGRGGRDEAYRASRSVLEVAEGGRRRARAEVVWRSSWSGRGGAASIVQTQRDCVRPCYEDRKGV